MLGKQELRLLVALRVIARVQAGGEGVLQRELINHIAGVNLLQDEWEVLGCDAEYPTGFNNIPALHAAVMWLRKHGYMMSSEELRRIPYEVTEEGVVLLDSLSDDWREWEMPEVVE